MLKKRLIGVITVRNGWAVQSFSYNEYLPVGKPECVAENLDRWGVDEIFIQVIDRSQKGLGPDIDLLNSIASSNIATPIIYAGGISNEKQATEVIRAGADRICVDSLLHSDHVALKQIAHRLGAQAVIALLPLSIDTRGGLKWYNHIQHTYVHLNNDTLSFLEGGVISEIILADKQNEGGISTFNFDLINQFEHVKLPLILFGGINAPGLIKNALEIHNVSAVAIGNPLNYKEHAVQQLRQQLTTAPIRPPVFRDQG